MKRLELANLIRYKTKTTTATFKDTDMLPLVNAFKNEIASLISQRNTSVWVIPATDTFTAAQREYAQPSDVLNHLISIEIAFSATTPLAYVKLEPINPRSWGKSLTEANITADFSNIAPRYFLRRRSFYLLSGAIDATTLGAASITAGVRVTYRAYPADLPDLTNNSVDLATDPTTTTFGFPTQFHELLARRVGMEWKQSRPKPIQLSQLELNYENDLEKQLQAISRENFDEEIIANVPQNTGHNF